MDTTTAHAAAGSQFTPVQRLARYFGELKAYRKNQRQYRQMLGLDDHLLRDMGLQRHEIMRRAAMAYSADGQD